MTERWGVKVTNVEIREIIPPREVQEAMNRQMSAERIRRAVVTESTGTREAAINVAEGEKQAAILRADGDKQSNILRAEGDKQSQLLRAEGFSAALDKIYSVAQTVDSKTMTLQYFETLKSMGAGAIHEVYLPDGIHQHAGELYQEPGRMSLGESAIGQIQIGAASWRDLNAVRHLEQVCFPLDAWPLFDIIGVLTFPNVVRLKASDAGRLVGFIAGDPRPSEGVAWIATIGVLPEYRGRGVGARLLEACESKLSLPRIKLCVRPSNQSAIGLYERFGYTRTATWPRYYQDGENALVFEKSR